MKLKSTELREAIENLLAARGYELIELRVLPRERAVCLQILIDHAEGSESVTVRDCVQVSRALGDDPAMNDLLPERHVLEVSSPGVDRPLTRPTHFRRFRGDEAVIRLHAARNGQKIFRGVIVEAGEDAVTITSGDDERLEIPLAEIQSAHLKVDPWKRRAKN